MIHNRSSRHKKIAGDFGEHLILYWLSKDGFECVHVDHTGIDLIATNHYTQERMGISVKTRNRATGKEQDHVSINREDFDKVQTACTTFGCVGYFAIIVDTDTRLYAFILSMEELLRIAPPGLRVSSWKMQPINIEMYRENPRIVVIEWTHQETRWFRSQTEDVQHEA